MDLEQLQSLRDRVAQATGPDLALDHAVCVALLGNPDGLFGDYRTYWWKSIGATSKDLRVTSSIDAALALVERLLGRKDWRLMCDADSDKDRFAALVGDGGWFFSATPALAILCALVAALLQQEQSK